MVFVWDFYRAHKFIKIRVRREILDLYWIRKDVTMAAMFSICLNQLFLSLLCRASQAQQLLKESEVQWNTLRIVHIQ